MSGTRTWRTSQKASATSKPPDGWREPSAAEVPFAASRTSCTRNTRNSSRFGTSSATSGRNVARWNGWPTTDSSTATPPLDSLPNTPTPTCHEIGRLPTIAAMSRKKRADLDDLIAEATVDCYNDSECVTGFYTMIDDNLARPFKTEVLGIEVTVTR